MLQAGFLHSLKAGRAAALALTLLAPWSYAPAATGADAGAEQRVSLPADMDKRVAACTACHGAEGRAADDGYYPRIAGKPAGYLYHQLLNFRDGRRQYAPMTALLETLPDAYLRDIAAHFAAQHPPYPNSARAPVPAAMLARGEQLVREGDRARGTPACIACHGSDLAGLTPSVPGLLGLPRDYIAAQLGAWQGGTRKTPAPDCMAQVLAGVAPGDIAAVSAWLAAQPVPADYTPREAPDHILPLACAGVPQPVADQEKK